MQHGGSRFRILTFCIPDSDLLFRIPIFRISVPTFCISDSDLLYSSFRFFSFRFRSTVFQIPTFSIPDFHFLNSKFWPFGLQIPTSLIPDSNPLYSCYSTPLASEFLAKPKPLDSDFCVSDNQRFGGFVCCFILFYLPGSCEEFSGFSILF